MTDQQDVYAQTVARGYRDGWTKEQFFARQVAKLAEELAEVVSHVSGIDRGLALAILYAGSVAREQFDIKELWKGEFSVETEKVKGEIADCQVVVFNLAESLAEIIGSTFSSSDAAVEKSGSDIGRGVRNS